jgi:hypothetical protein
MAKGESWFIGVKTVMLACPDCFTDYNTKLNY